MPNSQTRLLPDQKTLIHSLCNTADACLAKGQYARAELLYLKALGLAESLLGPDHTEVSTILNNLAVRFRSVERSSIAGACERRKESRRAAK